MPATLEEFRRALSDCGLMREDEVVAFLASLPADRLPTTAAELATEMFRHGKLTKYQAQVIYQKKTHALVFGNYVILERLGGGGMGQVFKARHRRMERIVALKILPLEMTNSEDALRRFHREVKAAARLIHPNIVTAYDADEAHGIHFLAMEFVEGENLSVLVKQNGPMPLEIAISCVLQAAKGLEYAHSEGVIHRDVKPSNLLLDRKGVVKILDMGLARIDESLETHRQMPQEEEGTHSGFVMGSVDYMSPEQGFDMRATDHRSDVYSLGATLHLLVTARPMYRGSTLVKRILAHRDQPLPSLRAVRPDLPEALDAAFQRMVAKRPEDRLQTMGEVVARLQACVGLPSPPPIILPASSLLPPIAGSLAQPLVAGSLAPPLVAGSEDTVATRQGADGTSPLAAPNMMLDAWLLEEQSIPTDAVLTPFSFSFSRRRRQRLWMVIGGIAVALVTMVVVWGWLQTWDGR